MEKLTCSNPNCIHQGAEQDSSNFRTRKSKRGFSSWCKDCLNSDSRNRGKRHKINHKQLKHEDLSPKKCSNPDCPNGPDLQPPTAFYRDNQSSSGLTGRCKICESKYRKKDIHKKNLEK